jgi:hypothetical protein
MLLLYSSSYMPSVAAILQSSITAIGLQICFYMGLTGFACAWHFRRTVSTDRRAALTHVAMPLLGGAFMVAVGIYSVPTFTPVVLAIGIGGLALGFIPLALGRLRKARA